MSNQTSFHFATTLSNQPAKQTGDTVGHHFKMFYITCIEIIFLSHTVYSTLGDCMFAAFCTYVVLPVVRRANISVDKLFCLSESVAGVLTFLRIRFSSATFFCRDAFDDKSCNNKIKIYAFRRRLDVVSSATRLRRLNLSSSLRFRQNISSADLRLNNIETFATCNIL